MPASRLPWWLLPLLMLLLASVAAGAQERVVNAPTLRYMAAGSEREIAANILTLDVERERLPSRLSVRAPPAGLATGAARCEGGRVITAPVDASAPVAASIDPLAPLVVVLTAPGSNRDRTLRDTVTVDLAIDTDHRTIVLTETAPDSGVFAGAVPVSGGDCFPAIGRSASVTLAFAGDAGSLPSTLTPPLDPASLVFDAASGALVDGVGVTLMTEAGTPAAVLGDDGVSAYPASVTSGAEVVDAGGRHYPAVTGRYRFPLVAAGRYRLRITPPPGYVAPSKAPAAALAALRAPGGGAFLLTGASTGGIVTLAATAPFAADTPLDRAAAPMLVLTRSLSMREAMPGDRIEARLELTNHDTAASGPLRLVDTLPPTLRYRSGSLRGANEPAVGESRSLTIELSSLAAGASIELRYVLTVVPGAATGEATLSARASGPLAVSNIAAAAVRIRPLLFADALTIIGQVGEGGDCAAPARGVAGARLLLEDGTFAVTDAAGLFHLEGVRVGRHVLALDAASLPAGLRPIDCARNTSSAGSATTRFVDGVGGLVQRVDFRVRRVATAATAPGLPITPPDDTTAAGNRDWLTGARPGITWLFPAPDYNPRAPVTRVVIAHAPDQRVALTIGDKPVDPLSFDATDSDGHGVVVSRWVGIPLAPGANRLVARILAADGQLVATLERTVTVSGSPARAVFDAARSLLAADGVTPPLIAVRVTDAAGRPVRAGTLVPFVVDPPRAALPDAARPGAAERPSAPVIGDDGLAFLPLRPTGQAGAVSLHVAFAVGDTERVSDVEAWLTPAMGAAGWTVVGFGAGSIGHDLLSRRAAALPAGERDGRIVDGQLALYARGRIKGSWLLTLAYDSARRPDPDRGLGGQVDPNRYYTIYGDASLQGHDAPSAAPLYLRLESRQAYALFGDFETGLGEGRLVRYVRTLTGAQAAYRGEHWRATGFAARVASRAGHDEIPGNGLSGPYRLRAQGIVPNTDTLRIEIRDRLHPDRVVATTSLSRSLDYEIDPAAGTLRFVKPVVSRDANLNPVVIVADYEVAGTGAERLAAGARIERRAGALVVGATIIHDETRTAVAGFAGIDARLRVAPGTTLSAEAANGGDRGIGGDSAFAAELEHHRAGLDFTAYAREQALGFGLGQQSLVEADTRKIGADLRWTAGALSLTGIGWYQTQLAGPGERIAGQARVEWRRGTRTLFAGADVASDTGLDGGDRQSRLLTLGVSQVLAGGALEMTAQTQFAPGGEHASVDFPARHQITAAWRWSPGLKLIGGYEIDDGAAFRTRTARLGVEVAPWRGGRFGASVADQGANEQGRRFAQYSIAQSLPLGAHWSLDATLDSTATLAGAIPTGAMVTPFQPVAAAGAIGQDAGDFHAATLGTAWRAGPWSARGRVEYRQGATDTRWSIGGDVLRTLGEGRSLAASARLYRIIDATGQSATTGSADLAIAWRLPASRWAVLDRLTLRRGDEAGGGAPPGTVPIGVGTSTTRLIDNLSIDYRGCSGVDASLYYGVKYVAGRDPDAAIGGLIDATGIALRRDLGERFDLGVVASVQHAWTDRRWAWSGGPMIGWSPAGEWWLTLGYNVAGYRDRDLAEDRYTRGGPYLTMRVKFDARDIGQAARALGGGR